MTDTIESLIRVKKTARIRWAQKITFGSVDLNAVDMRGGEGGSGENDSHKSTQEGHSDEAGNYFNIYDPTTTPNRHHRDNLSFFSLHSFAACK